jgi:Trk K+ transport system NAD-binding subunit
MILYSHLLYERLSPWLGLFERKRAYREEAQDQYMERHKVDVILFGLGRFGTRIARELEQRGYRVLGVDFDPNLIHGQEENRYEVYYGDAEDPEFLTSLPLEQARWVLSSLREKSVNFALLQGLRDHGYKGQVAVTAHTTTCARQLKQAGANLVLLPYADAASEAVDNLFGIIDEQP